MKITIEGPVKSQDIPNSYSVEIATMGGDADYFSNYTVSGFERGDHEDEDLLASLLRLLDMMGAQFPSGRSGRDHYFDTVADFEPWFEEIDLDQARTDWTFPNESEAEFKRRLELAQRVEAFQERVSDKRAALGIDQGLFDRFWPDDATDQSEYFEADFQGYEVYYYDEDLVKYCTTVEL